jgi:hypothetical protein
VFTCSDFITGLLAPTPLRTGNISHQSSPVRTSPQDSLPHTTQNRKHITPVFICTDFTTGLLAPTPLRTGNVSQQCSSVRTSPQDSLPHTTQNRKRITPVFICTDFTAGLLPHTTQNRKRMTPVFTCTDFTAGLPHHSEQETYHTSVHLYALHRRTPTPLRTGTVSHQCSPVRTSPQDSYTAQNRNRITPVFSCTDFSKKLRLHAVAWEPAAQRE